MRAKKNKIKNAGSGVILPLAVIIVLVLSMIGVGLIQLGQNARIQVVNNIAVLSARQAADAGMEHAINYIISEWNTATDKDAWLADWNDPDGLLVGHTLAAPITLSDTFGNAEFDYTINKGTRERGFQITSTGTAAGASRIVYASVVLKSSLFGIGAKEDIYIWPNWIIGTVPDDGDFAIQTNSIESAAITLKPNLVIPGDVVVGPGGDINVSIDYRPNKVDIDGETRASEDYIDFPPVYVPEYLSNLEFTEPNIDAEDPTKAYIYNNIKLDNLEFGTGVLQNTETLYIQGDVEIFVDGETYLNPDSNITVLEGSSMILYLGGNMLVMPGSSINYGLTPPESDEEIIIAAESISIIGTVAADGTANCTYIEFRPHNDFYGVIYAPDAFLKVAPDGDIYGAIVGGMEIELLPGGTFMYIPSLIDLPNVEVLYMGVKHGSWYEE